MSGKMKDDSAREKKGTLSCCVTSNFWGNFNVEFGHLYAMFPQNPQVKGFLND